MRVTPPELLADGFADAVVATDRLPEWVDATLARLRAEPSRQRLDRRLARWSVPLTPLSSETSDKSPADA